MDNALRPRKGQHWEDGPGWVPDQAPTPGLLELLHGLPRRAYNAVPSLNVDPFSATGETPAASNGMLDQLLHYGSWPARAATSVGGNALAGMMHSAAYPGEVAAGRAEPNIPESMGLAALMGMGGFARGGGAATPIAEIDPFLKKHMHGKSYATARNLHMDYAADAVKNGLEPMPIHDFVAQVSNRMPSQKARGTIDFYNDSAPVNFNTKWLRAANQDGALDPAKFKDLAEYRKRQNLEERAAYNGESGGKPPLGALYSNGSKSLGLAELLGMGEKPPRPSMPDGTYAPPKSGGTDYLEALKGAGLDRIKFDAVLDDVSSLPAADLMSIAAEYNRGRMPASKAAAIEGIKKRFLELRQIDTLTKNAAKTRPW